MLKYQNTRSIELQPKKYEERWSVRQGREGVESWDVYVASCPRTWEEVSRNNLLVDCPHRTRSF